MTERRGRPASAVGVARTIAPVAVRNAKGKVTGWRATYRDGDNIKRQVGIHSTQTAARRAAEDRVAELNKGVVPEGGLTLGEWMSIWPARVGRDPRTVKTHRHRITKYIYPHLPGGADRPLHQITRKAPARHPHRAARARPVQINDRRRDQQPLSGARLRLA